MSYNRPLKSEGLRQVRWPYGIGLFLTLIGAAATAAQPALVGRVVHDFLHSAEMPSFPLAILVSVFLLDAFATTTGRLILGWCSERFLSFMRLAFIRRIIRTPLAALRKFDRGDLANRIIEDVPIAQRPYFAIYPDLLSSLITVILCFSGLLLTSILLSVWLIGILLIAAILLVIALRRLNRAALSSRGAESRFSSFLYEIMANAMAVKAMRAEKWIDECVAERTEDSFLKGLSVVRSNALILPIINIGTQVGLVVVLLRGGMMVTSGQLEAAQLVSYFLFLIYLITPLVSLALALGELKEADASWERLDEISVRLPFEEGLEAASFDEELGAKPLRLKTRNLRYSYTDDLPDADNAIAISDIDIVGPGVVCLVGANGAGKSTLLGLAGGLFLPSEGEVYWDDMRVTEDTLRKIRSEALLLPQSRDVFSLTIRENLTMGACVSESEIWRLADELGVRSFFEDFPQGLDTIIGEDGVGLSGGQKQILYAMSALLRPTPVLLLDEFVSSVDERTKCRLMNYLLKIGEDKLILIVTHDETIQSYFPRHVHISGVG